MKMFHIDIIHHFEENVPHSWKRITLLKIHYIDEILIMLMKVYEVNEHSQLSSRFSILMKMYHIYENSSPWWGLIILLKIHHFDENLFSILMSISFQTMHFQH